MPLLGHRWLDRKALGTHTNLTALSKPRRRWMRSREIVLKLQLLRHFSPSYVRVQSFFLRLAVHVSVNHGSLRVCIRWVLTAFVLSSARIASYSFNTFSSSLLFVASASFTKPSRAAMRSSPAPNRTTNLSRHWCAVVLSPVRKQASRRFSYIVHIFEFSGGENSDSSGDAE